MDKRTLIDKAKMFWICKAEKYIKKGGYKNIKRGLRYLKYSTMLANKDEKDFLADGLRRVVQDQERRLYFKD